MKTWIAAAMLLGTLNVGQTSAAELADTACVGNCAISHTASPVLAINGAADTGCNLASTGFNKKCANYADDDTDKSSKDGKDDDDDDSGDGDGDGGDSDN